MLSQVCSLVERDSQLNSIQLVGCTTSHNGLIYAFQDTKNTLQWTPGVYLDQLSFVSYLNTVYLDFSAKSAIVWVKLICESCLPFHYGPFIRFSILIAAKLVFFNLLIVNWFVQLIYDRCIYVYTVYMYIMFCKFIIIRGCLICCRLIPVALTASIEDSKTIKPSLLHRVSHNKCAASRTTSSRKTPSFSPIF